MKKIIIITAAIVMAGMGLRAQDISTDTLPCGQRQPHFYYSSWYDTAYWYWHPEERMVRRGTVGWVVVYQPVLKIFKCVKDMCATPSV